MTVSKLIKKNLFYLKSLQLLENFIFYFFKQARCYLFNFFFIKIRVKKKKNSKPRRAPKLTDSHACAFLIKVKRVGPPSAACSRFFLGILVFYLILSFDFLFLIFFC